MTPSLLLLLLLAQAQGLDAPPEAAPAIASAAWWHYLTRGEATTLVLLPRGVAGAREGCLQVEPTFIPDGGENWGLNVGAPVRLRLWGGEEGAGLVRRKRFQVEGLEGSPLAEASFPDGVSVYGEAMVGWDAVLSGGLQRHLKLSLGAEAFTWGRIDVDGRRAMQRFNRNLEVAVKGLAVGIGQPGARDLGRAEVGWRLFGDRLYALGPGGTLLFPEGAGALRPGAFASVGLGVDHAR